MRRCLACALFALALTAPPATAAEHWIAPGSTRAAAPCTQAAPCRYDYVLNGAGSNAGDIVWVKPGTYDITSTPPVIVAERLDVRGQPGGPRPFFRSTSSLGFWSVDTTAGGTSVRHLAFESQAVTALTNRASATYADISVDAPEICMTSQGGRLTVSDARLVDPGGAPDGRCLFADGTSTGVTLRRTTIESSDVGNTAPVYLIPNGPILAEGLKVTAPGNGVHAEPAAAHATTLRRLDVSSGYIGVETYPNTLITDSRVVDRGLYAIGLNNGTLRNVTVYETAPGRRAVAVEANGRASIIQNSILSGEDADLFVDAAGTPGRVSISNSNFDDVDGPLESSTNNSAADPKLDPALRPLAGSPVIDRGRTHPDNGPVDLSGRPRQIGGAPDMGAFEYQPPAPPRPPTVCCAPPPSVDRTAPSLGRLAVSRRRVRRRRTVTFTFTSSEAGTAALAISRQTTGRRVGRSCVKPTRRNRSRRKCKRFVRSGRPISKTAVPGTNRMSHRPRRTGSFRVRLTVQDAAGNRSAPKTARFRVVRR